MEHDDASTVVHRPSAGSATLAIAVSAVGFGLMVVLAKAAAHRLPGPEIAWIRFAIGLAACVGAHALWPLKPHSVRGLLVRGLLGGAAVLCFFLSVEHLPVGIATLLNYTAPLWAALWAFLFLHEQVPKLTFAAMAVAFFGVLLVLRGESSSLSPGFGGWELVGVLSGMISGASVATIRELRRTDGSWEIFFAFNVGGLLVCAPSTYEHFLWPAPHEWLLLVAIGLFSVAAQLGLTWALRYATAAGGGVLMQLTPITAFLGGALAFGDRIPAASITGVGLAISGVAWGAWLASRRVEIAEDP